MTVYSYIEEAAGCQANIKVIGVGGGGCNAVERMLQYRMNGIEFIACNTDSLALQQYHAPTCLQLGRNLTRGLGAGGNPKIGRSAALEDENMICQHLTGSDMLFITAGMGGGTGTGASPVIARIARELGILTVAVVTLPFLFEGVRRQRIAEAGIKELEHFVDTLIVVPNHKLLSAVEPNTTIQDAFLKADEVLSNAVQGISDLITEPGNINVDFADVRTIMSGMGKAILGTGIGSGENRAETAINAAVSSPLLDDFSIDGARGVLINITGGSDLGIIEMNAACEKIRQNVDKEALIIVGHVCNPDFYGKMKITIIATGFEQNRTTEPLPISSLENVGPIMDRSQTPITVGARQEIDCEQGSSQVYATSSSISPPTDKHKSNPPNAEYGVVSNAIQDDGTIAKTEPSKRADTEQVIILPLKEPTDNQTSRTNFKPVRPELDPPNLKTKSDDFHAIPDYNKRDMASDAFKKDSKLERIAQRIYFGDINTPAFLRRKAD